MANAELMLDFLGDLLPWPSPGRILDRRSAKISRHRPTIAEQSLDEFGDVGNN